MGSGSWSSRDFANYTIETKACTIDSFGSVSYSSDTSAQDIYKSRSLNSALDPEGVVRECCDSEEHPNTIPVMLCLDVTGSMGQAAVEVSKQLNVIMTKLYEKYKDIEFLVMGIGDLAYDNVPIQASQFESDIRIAEQLDKIYFEFGGGGNVYESYTAAWFFGVNQTKLDCWNRGKKGIIITMGDETINPYLPKTPLTRSTEVFVQGDVETDSLYNQAKEKFDIYHIHVVHGHISELREEEVLKAFGSVIGIDNVTASSVNEIAEKIVGFVDKSVGESTNNISWQDSENTEEEKTPTESIINDNITW